MFIQSSRAFGFRNLSSDPVTWGQGLNLLTGPNGAGKTNTLETLHLLTGWGVLDNAPLSTLQAPGARGCALACRYEGEQKGEREIYLTPRKGLKDEGCRCSWTDLRVKTPSLPFMPAHMALIEGSPQVRRRYLDIVLSLLDPEHPRRLADLRQALRLKRRLLSQGNSAAAVERVLAPLSAFLWSKREKLVGELSALMRQNNLCPLPLKLELIRGGGGRAIDPHDDYHMAQSYYLRAERQAKTSLFGPSRDDFSFTLTDGRSARSAFSRGQRRRAALALVLAGARLIAETLKRKPVLIVDEVASELDASGRERTVQALLDLGCQVFAATAEWNGPSWPGSVWVLKEGHIRLIGE